MLTILSALGGLASSLLPDLIHGFFRAAQDKRDRAQELALVKAQLEVEKEKSEQERIAAAGKLAEINMRGITANLEADRTDAQETTRHGAPVGVPWVDALNASVRPVVTYCFFALFATQLIARIVGNPVDPTIWSEEVQALFGAVMGYYFGNRSLLHNRERS